MDESKRDGDASELVGGGALATWHLPARALRWVMGALAALIIYGNLAVALQPPAMGLTLLPRPAWLFDTFLMTGMFGSYTTTNLDFHITGLRDAQGETSSRGKWITLELRDHFPQRLGITYTQLYAPHHGEVLGAAGQRAAWATLAAKIRARHNRLHPRQGVTRVKLATLEWPIHPAGYRVGKRPNAMRLRPWLTEREPQ